MKFLQIIFFIFGLLLITQSANAGIEKIDEVELQAKKTLNLFLDGNPEAIYSQFDPILKNEVPFSDFKNLMLQIEKELDKIENMELLKSQYSENEGGIYSYVYNIVINGNKMEYSIHLKESDSKFHIRGFNFKIDPSTSIQQGISPLHIIVATLFGACILVQILCVIFFVKRKNLKRKWLYIIASFVGFPFGIGINWATGAFVFRFGFNIPAVSVSWPMNQPGVFLMSVFFPIGILLWLRVRSKKVDLPTPEIPPFENEGAKN